jgi:hypothetical protein
VPFGKTPLKKLFEEKRPMEGNRRTPNVAIYFFHKSPYSPKFGAIIRMIADMGNNKSMLASMDTGIEQRAGSSHRADFMDLFHKGEYVNMPTTSKGSDWPKQEKTPIISISPQVNKPIKPSLEEF